MGRGVMIANRGHALPKHDEQVVSVHSLFVFMKPRAEPSSSGRSDVATTQSVTIPVGHIGLAGELAVPAGAGGVVLFAHGSGSSRHSPRNQFVAKVIREAGVGTCLFDLLTRDEEAADVYDGHLRFNIPFLAQRLEVATHWIEARPETRHLGIGYFGSSTGGAAALLAAAELGAVVETVVSRGGRPDLADTVLPRVMASTLLIVGELDDVVLQFNRQAFQKMSCEKKLEIVPRATHLFEEPGALEKVAALAAAWFQSHLKPR
jgi:putative phosphoribosyl transferase